MFMRLGVAKMGENAVSHVFCDKATIVLYQLCAAAVIGGNDASKILGSSLADRVVEPTKSPALLTATKR
jgi:hypothetical protein